MISGGASEEEEVDIDASLEDKFKFMLEDELRVEGELISEEELTSEGELIGEEELVPEAELVSEGELTREDEFPLEDEELFPLTLTSPLTLTVLLQAKASRPAKNAHKCLYFINASHSINIVIHFHLYNPKVPSGTAAVKSGIWIISKRGKHHISLTERKRSAPVKIIKKSAANFMAKGIKK